MVPTHEDDVRRRTLQRVGAHLVAGQQWDQRIELWADDGMLEFPSCPAGRKRSYHGKPEILAYMSGTSGKIAVDGIEHA